MPQIRGNYAPKTLSQLPAGFGEQVNRQAKQQNHRSNNRNNSHAAERPDASTTVVLLHRNIRHDHTSYSRLTRPSHRLLSENGKNKREAEGKPLSSTRKSVVVGMIPAHPPMPIDPDCNTCLAEDNREPT